MLHSSPSILGFDKKNPLFGPTPQNEMIVVVILVVLYAQSTLVILIVLHAQSTLVILVVLHAQSTDQ